MLSDAKIYVKGYEDGLILSDLGITILRGSSIDIVPDTVLGIAKILGKPGDLVCSRTLKYRLIKLNIHFNNSELPDTSPYHEYTIDDIEALLSSLFINNYEPFEIEFTDRPSIFYKTVFDDSEVPKFYIEDGTIGYTLICYDPYVYGPEVTLPGLVGESVGLDLNTGSEVLEPIIIIIGNGSIPLITYGSNTSTFISAIPVGNIITINSEEGLIKNQNNINYIPYYSGDLPKYNPGESISLSVTNCSSFVLEYRIKNQI